MCVGWGCGGVGLPRTPPPPDRPKFGIFPLPLHFRSLSLSLGVFSLKFGCVSEGRGPKMCTFGILGLSRERHEKSPRERKKHEKTPVRETKERKWERMRKKKRENSGPPLFGPQPRAPTLSSPYFFWVWAPTPLALTFQRWALFAEIFWPHTYTQDPLHKANQTTKTLILAKVEIGQSRIAIKCFSCLAKHHVGQSRIRKSNK